MYVWPGLRIVFITCNHRKVIVLHSKKNMVKIATTHNHWEIKHYPDFNVFFFFLFFLPIREDVLTINSIF